MSSDLGYSMFHDVLFPPLARQESGNEILTLRRLKRFLPEPTHRFRDGALVVFDLETTGLDFEVDRIIEIGAQKFVGLELVAEFETLVATDVELTDEIIKLTGIRPEMLADAPKIESILPRFLDFIDGAILIAHNAEFDLGMTRAAAARQGIDLEWASFCTVKMARELLPGLENRRLDTLAKYYGLSFEARHRAIGDIKVTAAILKKILAQEAAKLNTWSDLAPYSAV